MMIRQNDKRRAVIDPDGGKVILMRNHGTKRDCWRMIWPAFEARGLRMLNAIAKEWVNKARAPEWPV